MGQRIPEKEIANFQFNVFCNVADILKVMEQHHIFDQFPETVCLLSKKNAKPKDCVEISVDAEDYYRIKSSEKDI